MWQFDQDAYLHNAFWGQHVQIRAFYDCNYAAAYGCNIPSNLSGGLWDGNWWNIAGNITQDPLKWYGNCVYGVDLSGDLDYLHVKICFIGAICSTASHYIHHHLYPSGANYIWAS